jgi:hypothetical protein
MWSWWPATVIDTAPPRHDQPKRHTPQRNTNFAQPPVVEEMVQGMLELTGQREDTGGYYRQKFEMAQKAWEVRCNDSAWG